MKTRLFLAIVQLRLREEVVTYFSLAGEPFRIGKMVRSF